MGLCELPVLGALVLVALACPECRPTYHPETFRWLGNGPQRMEQQSPPQDHTHFAGLARTPGSARRSSATFGPWERLTSPWSGWLCDPGTAKIRTKHPGSAGFFRTFIRFKNCIMRLCAKYSPDVLNGAQWSNNHYIEFKALQLYADRFFQVRPFTACGVEGGVCLSCKWMALETGGPSGYRMAQGTPKKWRCRELKAHMQSMLNLQSI